MLSNRPALTRSYAALDADHLDAVEFRPTLRDRLRSSVSVLSLARPEGGGRFHRLHRKLGRVFGRSGRYAGVQTVCEVADDEMTPGHGIRRSQTMPLAEEASLLSGAPLDDIELRSVNLHQPQARVAIGDGSLGAEQYVETSRGSICVAIQGDLHKPTIVTYHDLGLNYVANFQSFMNYPDMKIMAESFSFVHINAPGQEPGAKTLPEGYVYPSCEELAEQVREVIEKLQLKRCVGLGVGAGGNILSRLCLAHPELMECLVLINAVCTPPGWIEWGYQKMNVRHLRSSGMTQGVMDYLMWHHFGKLDEASHDLMHQYRSQFQSANGANLSLFIESYNQRTDLGIQRPAPAGKQEGVFLRVPVLLVCGNRSPYEDETVTFNSRLDPGKTQWMKIHDCSLPLDEQVAKVCEAFRLFLQGQGFAVRSRQRLQKVPLQ
ncbi:protein NDRG3-like isoform X3 [Amphibalanus amphitrite]|uniref:protein NDRG3-like isoform X3 n=1 Tax=Amphibalanus amphitrite TaxID=1232801 RepID=UPI001C9227EE|nr:protein NDRG3-like isoform X3 [Amphibalanus amphitrite]